MLRFKDQTTLPAVPPANNVWIFADTNGDIYTLKPNGTLTLLGGGYSFISSATTPLVPLLGNWWLNSTTGVLSYYDGTAWVPVGSGAAFTHQSFTPTAGQTVFTISSVPTAAAATLFNVNGVNYFQPDFNISTVTVTWAGPFTLSATDKVTISYA